MEQDIDQKSLISHAPFVAPERTDTEPKFKNRFDESLLYFYFIK